MYPKLQGYAAFITFPSTTFGYTSQLWDELVSTARKREDNYIAYYCSRKNVIDGKWLKHSFPPSQLLRFFMPGKVKFERLVHPVPRVDGAIGRLGSLLEHYPMSKGLFEFIERHNKYSTWESEESINVIEGGRPSLREIFTFDSKVRRAGLKKLSVFLPCRPLARFCYMMFVQGGILDGPVGWRYCTLMTIYEYFISLKTRELRKASREQS